MDLDTARSHISACVERMRKAYFAPVFDEWAILGLGENKSGVLAYHGPRPDAFKRNLPGDAEPLRARAAGRDFAEGDLEFVPDAGSTRYDAFMKIGPASYLVLNHTIKTMEQIRNDGRWVAAQAVLFELGEKFRADPLAVE